MKLLRDSMLVIGGAIVALAIQPLQALSRPAEPSVDQAQLAALLDILRVDRAGNLTLRTSGRVRIESTSDVSIIGYGVTRVQGTRLDLAANAEAVLQAPLTLIGRGRGSPVLTEASTILCPPPGGVCTVKKGTASVLVAP